MIKIKNHVFRFIKGKLFIGKALISDNGNYTGTLIW